jgi:hypothetical protein
MNVWLADLNRLADILTRHPSTPMEKWFIVGLALLAMITVFQIVASSLRIPNAEPFRCFVAVVFGTALMLLAMVAIRRYAPNLGGATLKPWLLPLAAAVTGLVICVPLTALWMRAKFLDCVGPWVAGVVASVAVVYLVGAAFDAVSTGNKDAKRVQKRKSDLEQLIR